MVCRGWWDYRPFTSSGRSHFSVSDARRLYFDGKQGPWYPGCLTIYGPLGTRVMSRESVPGRSRRSRHGSKEEDEKPTDEKPTPCSPTCSDTKNRIKVRHLLPGVLAEDSVIEYNLHIAGDVAAMRANMGAYPSFFIQPNDVMGQVCEVCEKAYEDSHEIDIRLREGVKK